MTNGISIIDPLCHINEIKEIILNEKILNFAKKQLETNEIYVGYVKLRRFFINDLPDFDTNYFHYDDNCEKILKCIVYLSDIETIDDGPFVYVKKSKNNRLASNNDENIYVRSDDEIKKYYDKQNIYPAIGKSGTVVFADTLGFHKGLKPKKKERNVLYINYVCEEEYGGKGQKPKISKAIYEQTEKYKNLFKYFEISNIQS